MLFYAILSATVLALPSPTVVRSTSMPAAPLQQLNPVIRSLTARPAATTMQRNPLGAFQATSIGETAFVPQRLSPISSPALSIRDGVVVSPVGLTRQAAGGPETAFVGTSSSPLRSNDGYVPSQPHPNSPFFEDAALSPRTRAANALLAPDIAPGTARSSAANSQTGLVEGPQTQSQHLRDQVDGNSPAPVPAKMSNLAKAAIVGGVLGVSGLAAGLGVIIAKNKGLESDVRAANNPASKAAPIDPTGWP